MARASERELRELRAVSESKEGSKHNDIEDKINNLRSYLDEFNFDDFHECKKYECECETLNVVQDNKEPTCRECKKKFSELLSNKDYIEKIDKYYHLNARMKFIKIAIKMIKELSKAFEVPFQPTMVKLLIDKEWRKIKNNKKMLITYENF